MHRHIVVLTGAGISAESGIPTFRAPDGHGPALWDDYDIDDVATPAGYARNPELVYTFYRARRAAGAAAEPNAAHVALAELARHRDVLVVTQNVDDLHERAGLPSRRLIHMHGQLRTALCPVCLSRIPGGEYGERCSACGAGILRPDVVWFGERPYEMARIERAVADADLFVAIGTSGEVYPAAGLVDIAAEFAVPTVEVNLAATSGSFDRTMLGPATVTVPALVRELLAEE